MSESPSALRGGLKLATSVSSSLESIGTDIPGEVCRETTLPTPGCRSQQILSSECQSQEILQSPGYQCSEVLGEEQYITNDNTINPRSNIDPLSPPYNLTADPLPDSVSPTVSPLTCLTSTGSPGSSQVAQTEVTAPQLTLMSPVKQLGSSAASAVVAVRQRQLLYVPFVAEWSSREGREEPTGRLAGSDTDLALDMRQIRPQNATNVSSCSRESLSTTTTTAVADSVSRLEPPLVYVCPRLSLSATPTVPSDDPCRGRSDDRLYTTTIPASSGQFNMTATCDSAGEWQDRVLHQIIDGGATQRQVILTIDQSQRLNLDSAERYRREETLQQKTEQMRGQTGSSCELNYDCVSTLAEPSSIADIPASSIHFESTNARANTSDALPSGFSAQFSTELGDELQAASVDSRSDALNIVLHADVFTSTQQKQQQQQDGDLQADFPAPTTANEFTESGDFPVATPQDPDPQPPGSTTSHERRAGRLQCPICGQAQERLFWLRQHVKTHLVNGVYSCPFCEDKKFTAYSKIRKHIRSIHGDMSYVCPVCRKAFAASDKLRLHMLRHSDHREFLCAECGKQFKRKDKLKEHVNRKHVIVDRGLGTESSGSGGGADERGQTVTTTQTALLTSPVNNLADYQKFIYKCRWCRIGFKRRGMLVNHLATRHAGYDPQEVPELLLPLTSTSRYYYCHLCDKVYKSSSKRKRHILKCHPEAPVPSRSDQTDSSYGDSSYSCVAGCVTSEPHCCAWCHRQYASRAKLLQHQRKLHADQLSTHTHAHTACSSATAQLPGTGYKPRDDTQISTSLSPAIS